MKPSGRGSNGASLAFSLALGLVAALAHRTDIAALLLSIVLVRLALSKAIQANTYRKGDPA